MSSATLPLLSGSRARLTLVRRSCRGYLDVNGGGRYDDEALRESPKTANRKMKGVLMARLLSVNVGRPREIAWRGKIVYTSAWKEPVWGRRQVPDAA